MTKTLTFKREAIKEFGILLSPEDGNQLIVSYVELFWRVS